MAALLLEEPFQQTKEMTASMSSGGEMRPPNTVSSSTRNDWTFLPHMTCDTAVNQSRRADVITSVIMHKEAV